MSLNLPDHYTISFTTNVMLLLQERGSKLRGCVTVGNYVGKSSAVVDQFGSVEMQEVTSRFAPMVRTDGAVDRRWVNPSDFDLTQQIDSFDKLRLLTDPESSYTQNAVFAAGRKMDRLIIVAFTGTAKTGEQGATSTSFTSGNEIDVAIGGANSRLNVQKLINLQETMIGNSVDFDTEEIYVGLTAKDNAALMGEVQVVSSDFAPKDKPVLESGRVRHFLGMNFVYCQLIESVATGTNEVNVPAWAKSGMHLGIWNDVTTDISQRKDLRGLPWQSYVTGTFGATRLEENKVYNVESYRA
jgi:autonomous glycyl radical cofactor GrcA